ncbi:hypothetical protein [Pseudonocardia acaciae]|uniref:hypothetical protein n=1 Tax=Pseudonocardia acaciae TaxID=551276 RepID=UPI00048F8FAA|nr:hypothetical protein [Pseudonocardia acaciae]
MSSEQERFAAGRAVFARVVADDVAAEAKKTRRVVEPTLAPGEPIKAWLPDGTEVGKVRLTERPESVVLTDEAALLAYVRRARPDELVVTESIRESYLTYLRELARAQLKDPHNTDGLVVDRDGEVIPGLELSYGTPAYKVEPSPSGRVAVRAVLARVLGSEPEDGSLLAALTAGGEERR